MNALVTGGSGYFGSLLIDKLLKKGFNVSSLDINAPDNLNESVKFYRADIRDGETLKTLFKGVDLVFHNVAQVPLAKDATLFNEVNINGTRNVCSAALHNNIEKIIYTSSSAIYGVPKSNPVDENTLAMPGESYGEAKLYGEKICESFSKKGVNVSIIRPRTILGHGRLGIFSIFFNWISQGVNIPVLNEGRNLYQFIHAEDLADACILSSKFDSKLSYFNIGSEDFGTMRKTIQDLCDYANTGSKVYSLPLKPIEIIMNVTSKLGLSPLGPYHSLMYGRSLYFNITKAKKELGFDPKYSTSQMFQESYDWFLENKQKLSSSENTSAHKRIVNESILKVLRWFS
tara:strand:- start:141 stop:1172 length:1032 start_codon:yes stop_codon:yes gene_type:complete